jgi:hypothetical protein
MILTLVLLLALLGVIAIAVTQMPTARPSQRPNSAAAPAEVAGAVKSAGAPADASTQQAIQEVIRKLDEEQSRAISTSDQTVMSDTSTPEFLAQQIATNQDLVANGVTEIKLVSIEWGPITVSGNSATATAYETWSLTFDDGTVAQARDRNDYTLVKDNTRGWIVQADDHPDQRNNPPTY